MCGTCGMVCLLTGQLLIRFIGIFCYYNFFLVCLFVSFYSAYVVVFPMNLNKNCKHRPFTTIWKKSSAYNKEWFSFLAYFLFSFVVGYLPHSEAIKWKTKSTNLFRKQRVLENIVQTTYSLHFISYQDD